uniref:(northern house mosquito) hypothetical protein n=1 Tax=Culex pipiens TaxID=7175 RepID=A0A8D8F8C9_CULPI
MTSLNPRSKNRGHSPFGTFSPWTSSFYSCSLSSPLKQCLFSSPSPKWEKTTLSTASGDDFHKMPISQRGASPAGQLWPLAETRSTTRKTWIFPRKNRPEKCKRVSRAANST